MNEIHLSESCLGRDGSWLWKVVMEVGYGSWVWKLVMEVGYGSWL